MINLGEFMSKRSFILLIHIILLFFNAYLCYITFNSTLSLLLITTLLLNTISIIAYLLHIYINAHRIGIRAWLDLLFIYAVLIALTCTCIIITISMLRTLLAINLPYTALTLLILSSLWIITSMGRRVILVLFRSLIFSALILILLCFFHKASLQALPLGVMSACIGLGLLNLLKILYDTLYNHLMIPASTSCTLLLTFLSSKSLTNLVIVGHVQTLILLYLILSLIIMAYIPMYLLMYLELSLYDEKYRYVFPRILRFPYKPLHVIITMLIIIIAKYFISSCLIRELQVSAISIVSLTFILTLLTVLHLKYGR